MTICDKYSVPVVEDSAESLGTTYKEKQTGSFGKFGIFSFNGNKIITTSGGGMLVSNDEAAIQKHASFLLKHVIQQFIMSIAISVITIV